MMLSVLKYTKASFPKPFMGKTFDNQALYFVRFQKADH